MYIGQKAFHMLFQNNLMLILGEENEWICLSNVTNLDLI